MQIGIQQRHHLDRSRGVHTPTCGFKVLLIILTAAVPMSATTLMPECDPSPIILSVDTDTSDPGPLWINQSQESELIWESVLLSLGTGDTVLVIDPETVTFKGGTMSEIDTVQLWRLFDYLATEAVRHAVACGRLAPGVPLSTANIDVYIPTCALRYGSGSSTYFLNVSDCDQAVRTIEHAVSQGAFSGWISAISGETECMSGEATVMVGTGIQ